MFAPTNVQWTFRASLIELSCNNLSAETKIVNIISGNP